MAAVSRGTTSVDIQKTRKKREKLFTHVESNASAVSLLESGEQRYIKAINNNNMFDIQLCFFAQEHRLRCTQHGVQSRSYCGATTRVHGNCPLLLLNVLVVWFTLRVSLRLL